MLAWQVERLIHVGAEAEVSSGLYLGLPAIMKIRKPRSYRNPQLDRRLTTSRMMAEARMLSRLSQSSLPVPNILACEMSKGMMVQSLMPGKQIVDILRNSATDVKTAMRLVGNAIRQLHSVGAIHGDLTTNNLL
ncbi:MAG: Kae1-associated serine/threonine protein kinase, partial [Euryarchaeota archaeon]|nr:Kae1-associated serine/threonine protein kinase [Euryarchaeota archaeon]